MPYALGEPVESESKPRVTRNRLIRPRIRNIIRMTKLLRLIARVMVWS